MVHDQAGAAVRGGEPSIGVERSEAGGAIAGGMGRFAWWDLLRRYWSMYWLKPLVAVNDAANAWALKQFAWQDPILEIGAGDGVFSFVMHGGAYQLNDDRYDQADPGRAGDMFDISPQQTTPLAIRQRAALRYTCGVDVKWSHVRKCQETQLYQLAVQALPEPLPFADASFSTVFLYFPHGLIEAGRTVDYPRVLQEIRRVLRPDGTLLMTGINDVIRACFVCYPLQRLCERRGWRRLAAYFGRLDARRYEELSGLSRSLEEWRRLLRSAGLRLVEGWSQVRPFAWMLYDVQTRPIERPLACASQWLRRLGVKRAVKMVCLSATLPILALFYLVWVRPRRIHPEQRTARDIFFAFRAVPETGRVAAT